VRLSNSSRRAEPPKRARPSVGSDDGSASLEFLATGVLLLVPIVYLIVAISAIQGAAFAAEGAARAAARAYVQAEDATAGDRIAQGILTMAAEDFGIDPGAASARITCVPSTRDCLQPDAVVTVTVDIQVPLPLVPAGLDAAVPLHVPVSASAVQQVSIFAAADR
jgi:hypothetical protein